MAKKVWGCQKGAKLSSPFFMQSVIENYTDYNLIKSKATTYASNMHYLHFSQNSFTTLFNETSNLE